MTLTMNDESKNTNNDNFIDVESFKLELSKKLVVLIHHPNASQETKDELSEVVSDLVGVK